MPGHLTVSLPAAAAAAAAGAAAQINCPYTSPIRSLGPNLITAERSHDLARPAIARPVNHVTTERPKRRRSRLTRHCTPTRSHKLQDWTSTDGTGRDNEGLDNYGQILPVQVKQRRPVGNRSLLKTSSISTSKEFILFLTTV